MKVLLASVVLPFLSLTAVAHSQALRDAASKRHFNLGTAVQVGWLRDDVDGGKYAATIPAEFNLIELENDLKPPAVWTGPTEYNFCNADYILGAPKESGWAQKREVKVRGHVLVYARDDGYTLPGWLRTSEAQLSKEQATQLLHDYIHTLVGRYRGKIAMWDVANEAIDDRPNNRPFNLRDSLWFRKLGPDFLLLAFKWAHEADPRAELYYNEYSVEWGGTKAEHLLDLVRWLKEHGAPITGVGLQYHIDYHTVVAPGDGRYQLVQTLDKMRLAFMITELDVSIPVNRLPRTDPHYGAEPKNPADLEAQAKVYADVFRLATSSRNCHGVNVWGFTDRHSWIPQYQPGSGAATLFDADYNPKPAYAAVRDVLAK
jgi:endo-1,4-beta-xylanase